ncbi:hypothetical protein TPHA_0C01640 [Tetrapisispora phaffii CBS 4417]|uniref:Glycosyltransferase family 15 protein n=1 Tax=Tetrapisispora phaffii (strain ATCC 24235 / CBS 4417 / NBRC 1672 / NRRL Y-8282 / UCD 70-5) TaxID=1071381 RepID=G8BRE4_TETPH|nr:hypothetical protein TPHA_0C01640 [Tetrapisispora phaffii CBS 4417]CCE62320.1 hypothetical protein TPHA_0C01640 [Tetrapisispora phaffii CBS 4417]
MRLRTIYIKKKFLKLLFVSFSIISLITILTKITNNLTTSPPPPPPLVINKDRILNTFPSVNATYDIMKDLEDSFSEDKIGTRPSACFVTLVRNEEMDDMVNSVAYIREKFNKNYNYPWVFLNDEEFTDEFKDKISEAAGNITIEYGLVPEEHWSYPDYIDTDKAAETRIRMSDIIYGDSESYRHMCRYQSGFFWRHELLDKYDWYWRVEPGIGYFCDILDDPFQYMQDNKKVYGFTITIHEFESTIKSLWQTTRDFVANNTEYIAKNNLIDFISDNNGETYNLCHFWSNFEIGNLNFWRSEAYNEYFDYLDHAGGFFYERWGDAPVHSIAASLFLPKDAIHFFPEISYYHVPYTNCPIDNAIYEKYNCECNQDDDFTWQDYSCGVQYHNAQNLTKPMGWTNHTG